MSHPLDGAYLRRDRAKHHLRELSAQVEDMRKTFTGTLLRQSSAPITPIPPLWSILTGEVAYNLCAALDYLVYELWWHDDGTEPGKSSAFGRASGREKLTAQHRMMLDHVELFDQLPRCDRPVLRDVSQSHTTFHGRRLARLLGKRVNCLGGTSPHLDQFGQMRKFGTFRVRPVSFQQFGDPGEQAQVLG